MVERLSSDRTGPSEERRSCGAEDSHPDDAVGPVRSAVSGLSSEAVEAVLESTTFLAEHASLYTVPDSDPNQPVLIGSRGPSPFDGEPPSSLTRGLVAQVLEAGRAELPSLPADTRSLALSINLVENAAAVLLLARPSGPAFSTADLAAARALASIAGSLFRMEQLQAASRELAVQAERNRIAGEIHDGVSQNLALLMLKMEIISRLADSDPQRVKTEVRKLVAILETSIQELRRSIHALRAP